jgi:hypothetical protein
VGFVAAHQVFGGDNEDLYAAFLSLLTKHGLTQYIIGRRGARAEPLFLMGSSCQRIFSGDNEDLYAAFRSLLTKHGLT